MHILHNPPLTNLMHLHVMEDMHSKVHACVPCTLYTFSITISHICTCTCMYMYIVVYKGHV